MILNQFRVKKTLGRGAYAKVMLVERKGVEYAIKQISKQTIKQSSLLEQYFNEYKTCMNQVHSDHLMSILETYEDAHFHYLVCEYCSGGNILSYQSRLPDKVFKLDKAIKAIAHVTKGLLELHSAHYLHGDIKPENILIHTQKDGTETFKVADFGFIRKEGQATASLMTTPYFTPPEVFSKSEQGFGVDMWALGVTLYWMLNLEYPFPLINEVQYNLEKLKKTCTPKFSYQEAVKVSNKKLIANCTPEVNNLFERIFTLDIDNRLTFHELKQHVLFRSYFEGDKSTIEKSMLVYQDKFQIKLKPSMIIPKQNQEIRQVSTEHEQTPRNQGISPRHFKKTSPTHPPEQSPKYTIVVNEPSITKYQSKQSLYKISEKNSAYEKSHSNYPEQSMKVVIYNTIEEEYLLQKHEQQKFAFHLKKVKEQPIVNNASIVNKPILKPNTSVNQPSQIHKFQPSTIKEHNKFNYPSQLMLDSRPYEDNQPSTFKKKPILKQLDIMSHRSEDFDISANIMQSRINTPTATKVDPPSNDNTNSLKQYSIISEKILTNKFKEQIAEYIYYKERNQFLLAVSESFMQTQTMIPNQIKYALRYYTLKMYIVCTRSLIKEYENKRIPANSKPHLHWIDFFDSKEYKSLVVDVITKLSYQEVKFETVYLECKSRLDKINTAIKGFQAGFTKDIKQTEFQGNFKTGYRNTTSVAYGLLQQRLKAEKKAQNIENLENIFFVQINIFICHCFNRIFVKDTIREAFDYYFKWKYEKSKIQQLKVQQFDFESFKQWLTVQKSSILKKTIDSLVLKYF